jgi:hypothetical protein
MTTSEAQSAVANAEKRLAQAKAAAEKVQTAIVATQARLGEIAAMPEVDLKIVVEEKNKTKLLERLGVELEAAAAAATVAEGDLLNNVKAAEADAAFNEWCREHREWLEGVDEECGGRMKKGRALLEASEAANCRPGVLEVSVRRTSNFVFELRGGRDGGTPLELSSKGLSRITTSETVAEWDKRFPGSSSPQSMPGAWAPLAPGPAGPPPDALSLWPQPPSKPPAEG